MSALPKEFVRSTKANLGNTYGKGLKGLKRSAAVKAKIAAALKGKNPTAETKAKMPAAMKGHTDRKGKKGTARSAETKAEVLATNSAPGHSSLRKFCADGEGGCWGEGHSLPPHGMQVSHGSVGTST
eukprot:XP_001689542.1 predicted protein [Chlamydomonas reinhardtii]